MSIVAPTPSPNTPRARFASPPWHDQHPDRLALEARLPPDHLAHRIDAAVARLDRSDLCAAYAGTGSDPYPPDLLLRVVLFETSRGQHSPATWFRDTQECEPVRWLLRGCCPSRSCWYTFRDRLAPLLDSLNDQPLPLAVAQGLTPATRAAVDGTLVAANASRHHLCNEAKLDQRLGQLAAAVAADQAAAAPPTVPAGAAPPVVPAWMAKQPASRAAQHARFTKARAELSTRQARNQRKRPSKRTAPAKIVVSPGDVEAAISLDKEKVFRPLYNVQVVDDLDSPFILGYEVFAQPNDAGLLGTMLGRVQALVGHPLQALLADTAYVGGADLKAAADARVTVYGPLPKEAQEKTKQLPKSAFRWDAATQTYVCPQEQRLVKERTSKQKRSGVEEVVLHSYRCPPVHCSVCPLREACTKNPAAGRTISRGDHEDLIAELQQRMGTEAAKTLYQLRKQTVELVNADWKAHRKLRRFSGRGLTRVRCQVGLIVLAHNLLTLLKEEQKARAAADAATPGEIST